MDESVRRRHEPRSSGLRKETIPSAVCTQEEESGGLLLDTCHENVHRSDMNVAAWNLIRPTELVSGGDGRYDLGSHRPPSLPIIAHYCSSPPQEPKSKTVVRTVS